MNDISLTVSAPGKLFLFGEYGVLAGGWCMVAAVDRRVRAHLFERALGYRVEGADLDDPGALPRALLAELDHSELDIDRLVTDVRALFHEGHAKLGLGSSAASTVALGALCLLDSSAHDIDPALRARIFETAFAAHRRLQNGRGSCADVAASTFGGIVGYRLEAPDPRFAKLTQPQTPWAGEHELYRHARVAHPMRSPQDLRVEAVWLGEPAVSTSFVKSCERALADRPELVAQRLTSLSLIAAEALEAWTEGDIASILQLVDRADRGLEQLGEAIGAPIVVERHRQLRKVGAGCGIHVKPSGAGGGDFSLAFAPRTVDWSAFMERLPAGCVHIPLAFGVEGVRHDS